MIEQVLRGDVRHACECGDALSLARTLPDSSIQCVVTSPPYWGLRDYGVESQIGLERTPELYVSRLVELFREIRRAMKKDGTLWLNLGDTYTRNPAKGGSGPNGKHDFIPDYGKAREIVRSKRVERGSGRWGGGNATVDGVKEKNLIGIPWRVAFALQSDGWYLRSDVIWAKPNPMPESVTDRPTKSHEYVFLLSKSERYFYDGDAIAEKAVGVKGGSSFGKQNHDTNGTGQQSRKYERPDYETRNARSVWAIPTKSYHGAHFAVMPEELARRCVLAGSRPGDVVLDPFAGSGTTLAVAVEHGRRAIGFELNRTYIDECQSARLATVTPDMFASAAVA